MFRTSLFFSPYTLILWLLFTCGVEVLAVSTLGCVMLCFLLSVLDGGKEYDKVTYSRVLVCVLYQIDRSTELLLNFLSWKSYKFCLFWVLYEFYFTSQVLIALKNFCNLGFLLLSDRKIQYTLGLSTVSKKFFCPAPKLSDCANVQPA